MLLVDVASPSFILMTDIAIPFFSGTLGCLVYYHQDLILYAESYYSSLAGVYFNNSLYMAIQLLALCIIRKGLAASAN
jgi:hypothetical protein